MPDPEEQSTLMPGTEPGSGVTPPQQPPRELSYTSAALPQQHPGHCSPSQGSGTAAEAGPGPAVDPFTAKSQLETPDSLGTTPRRQVLAPAAEGQNR